MRLHAYFQAESDVPPSLRRDRDSPASSGTEGILLSRPRPLQYYRAPPVACFLAHGGTTELPLPPVSHPHSCGGSSDILHPDPPPDGSLVGALCRLIQPPSLAVAFPACRHPSSSPRQPPARAARASLPRSVPPLDTEKCVDGTHDM
jgi:hypothetical protein